MLFYSLHVIYDFIRLFLDELSEMFDEARVPRLFLIFAAMFDMFNEG